MMNWLLRLTGYRASTTTIKLSGKDIEVLCSASANKALAQRSQPLIVEMELAFACFARKTIRFHEQLPDCEFAYVTEKLAVYAQAVIPDRCETSQAANGLGNIVFDGVLTGARATRWLVLPFLPASNSLS